MAQKFLLILIGFAAGILATVIVERVMLRFRYNDPGRKVKLEHLQKVRDWIQSYNALFEATYPECPELILAHKMLSRQYPHYDQSAAAKLLQALLEYHSLRLKHDTMTQEAMNSLAALGDKRLERLYGLNKTLSNFLQKVKILKGSYLFPLTFPREMENHLKLIDQYRGKVFEEFPRKVIDEIEWEKLEKVTPQDLHTIIHPCLSYFRTNEDISRDREKESRLFDEMQNLSFYRIVAKKELETVLQKIQRLEDKYCMTNI